MQNKEIILEVKNLRTYFQTNQGINKSVNGVTFNVYKGETIGLVGESGSGKSVTSLSIMRLLDTMHGHMVEGEIKFKKDNLLKKSEKEMQALRGNTLSMIFQEPMTSLNPVYSIGEQIAEVFRRHHSLNRKQAWEKAVEMLKLVGIPSPEKRAKQEPFELSGGMRQRVMIAMSLACQPSLLIADEPTTALDVTIQAQILELMKDLQNKFGMAILLITHDIGVIVDTCDRVAVMYAGQIVESLYVDDLFENAKHPYTIGLLRSIPRMDKEVDMLEAMEGSVPSPNEMPSGCPFSPRCAYAKDICIKRNPEFTQISKNHSIRCWIYEDSCKQTEAVTKGER
ncbi:ABC transporter ATP-binding protein [Niallia sp. NCCP-28]|uniref:ABC transporter ATP-binding protein n=1 Tax=Niallia sp. NCCP-28 TaxID=2934712 RepID=UPI00208AE9D9|nr:ABC transporter ATP-binding protein [Niallia sp. NCCP-28]GKU85075.1 peptide ABC transporter ATP-binding protein [Niallia sp. NCCP-28]